VKDYIIRTTQLDDATHEAILDKLQQVGFHHYNWEALKQNKQGHIRIIIGDSPRQSFLQKYHRKSSWLRSTPITVGEIFHLTSI